MLGPFATASRLTPIHQMSLAVLSLAAYASMSTTTTTTRDRGDHYGPMEWVQTSDGLALLTTKSRKIRVNKGFGIRLHGKYNTATCGRIYLNAHKTAQRRHQEVAA